MVRNQDARQCTDSSTRPVAFVLGGGGVRGAVEVGQARALFEAGIVPDMIIGTSIGAINGALIARTPSLDVIEPMKQAWSSDLAKKIYGQSLPRQISNLIRHRNHLLSPEPLRSLLAEHLGSATRFEDLTVPFSVVAASVEGACERWFDSGPVIPAVIASSSVPGILPPAEINGEHLYDGGLVSSIPLGRAIEQGARTIYVLQVGRIEEPLARPTNVVGSMWVSFEISRRHRFARDLAELPEGVTVHVLPSGGVPPGGKRNATMPTLAGSDGRMEQAYQRSVCFLAESDEVNALYNPEGDLSVECPYGMTVQGSGSLRRQGKP